MYVRDVLFILSLIFLSVTAAAETAGLNKCLAQATYREHRLEKEDSIRNCFNNHKSALKREVCYKNATKSVNLVHSTTLLNDLISTCFYETESFQNLKDCLVDTDKFKNASAHDEAVFYCYQTFQDKMTKKDCSETAEALIFPAKKNYLSRHCMEN